MGYVSRQCPTGIREAVPGFRWASRSGLSPRPLTNDQSVALERYEQEMMNASSSTVPVVQPLAVGNTVVIRMVDRIAGVDFQTGKVQWTYPGGSKLFSQERDSVRIKDNLLNQQAFSQRMWSDHIFGQMTSDRNSIFVVPNPGSAGQLAYLGEVNRKAFVRSASNTRVQ